MSTRDEHNFSPRFPTALCFCVLRDAFSAMIGGMATPSGGGRNPLMIEYLWRLEGLKVSYLQWTIMVLPVVAVLIPVMYFILRLTFRTGIKELNPECRSDSKETFTEKMTDKLQPNEKLSILIFGFILFLWIFFSDTLGMGGKPTGH